jgi:hypothetical protein
LPNWILVVSLIVLAVFPFTVFVIHVGRGQAVVVANGHRDSLAEARLAARLADQVESRRFIKEGRARRHVTPGVAIVGLAVPAFWVALFGVVGRRGFALRV